jgi:hypothetical protein
MLFPGSTQRTQKEKAEKALKDGDRDGARGFLAELIDGSDSDPPCPRIIINDATVEKLGELLNENPRGVLLIRDELSGFLARMENEEHQSERAFYLEAFNGDGRFTYDRIGRGTIHIEYSHRQHHGGCAAFSDRANCSWCHVRRQQRWFDSAPSNGGMAR